MQANRKAPKLLEVGMDSLHKQSIQQM